MARSQPESERVWPVIRRMAPEAEAVLRRNGEVTVIFSGPDRRPHVG